MASCAHQVRKLAQELGIDAKEVPTSQFRFLTRLHYWAADVVTHGPNSPSVLHALSPPTGLFVYWLLFAFAILKGVLLILRY